MFDPDSARAEVASMGNITATIRKRFIACYPWVGFSVFTVKTAST